MFISGYKRFVIFDTTYQQNNFYEKALFGSMDYNLENIKFNVLDSLNNGVNTILSHSRKIPNSNLSVVTRFRNIENVEIGLYDNECLTPILPFKTIFKGNHNDLIMEHLIDREGNSYVFCNIGKSSPAYNIFKFGNVYVYDKNLNLKKQFTIERAVNELSAIWDKDSNIVVAYSYMNDWGKENIKVTKYDRNFNIIKKSSNDTVNSFNCALNVTDLNLDQFPLDSLVIPPFDINKYLKEYYDCKKEKIKDFLVYPNYFDNYFEIKSPKNFKGTYSIYNSIGQKVSDTREIKQSTIVQADHLASGIYYLYITNDNDYTKVFKILKM